MNTEILAVGTLLASCASILLVTCALQNIKAWGETHGLRDLPAGAILGLTSVAQMIHPIEPYQGFIFDLRVLPLALAGAFTSWRAALLAALLAGSARIGIGGTGMLPGLLAVFGAVMMGQLWQALRQLGFLRARTGYLALGAMAATTLAAGALLPEPVRLWFFTNAAPVLGVIYLTLLPGLAWIAANGLVLDTVRRQAGRAFAQRNEANLLSLPALLHQMRLDQLLNDGKAVSAVLCLRLTHMDHLTSHDSRLHADDLLEATFLKLSRDQTEFPVAAKLKADTLLIPITSEQLTRLDHLRHQIKDRLHHAPLALPGRIKQPISYELSLLSRAALEDGEPLVPRRVAKSPLIDRHVGPEQGRAAPNPPENRAPQSRKGRRLVALNNAEMLFLKARMLMEDPG